MANIILPPGWRIPESQATPRDVYLRRREFVRALGIGVAALGSAACGSTFIANEEDPVEPDPPGPVDPTTPTDPVDPPWTCEDDPPREPLHTICASPNADLYPAERNTTYTLGSRPITDRSITSTYNNYYEFLQRAGSMWRLTGPFRVRPWTVTFSGLCNAPATWDIDALERMFGIEERLYRLRCVETWAIAVPWSGYPLRKLIELAEPLSSAGYVTFRSYHLPEQAIGQESGSQYEWPYYEALRLDEAMNDLAFVVTGAYGEPLPKQNGAPLRLALPWKYGYKSTKAFLEVEFTDTKPRTFWSDLSPAQYGFYSNVNPDVGTPWSQANERHLPNNSPQPTQLFNGYGEFVADLYDPELLTRVS
jgi:sulfoxide reductase catalytic subunit YedY